MAYTTKVVFIMVPLLFYDFMVAAAWRFWTCMKKEEDLKRSAGGRAGENALLETAFHGYNTPLWLMDGDRRVLLANKAAEALFGRKLEGLKGGRCYELLGLDAPHAACPLEKAIKGGARAAAELEAGGREREAVIDPLPGAGAPSPVAVHSMAAPAARRCGRAESLRLSAELEKRHAEMQDFLLLSAHDIRTPLLCIQGFSKYLRSDVARLTEMLETGDGGKESRAQALDMARNLAPESIDSLEESAAKIAGLLDGIIKVAKQGRLEMRPEPVDAAAVIRKELAAMAYQVEAAGARVEVGSLPWCTADPGAVGQIFANLLSNAIRHRHGARKPVIVVSGSEKGGVSLYRVADNGPGIKAADLPKIWKLFFSVPGNSGKCDGIGLPIARRLAEANGGRLWAESSEGEGSVFYLELPR